MKFNKKYLLALLGLPVVTACPVMYGCPHADFSIKCEVVNDEGAPVEGIEVRYKYAKDTTGVDGKVLLQGSDVNVSMSESVILRDIDGEEHGKYLPKEAAVNFTQVKPGDGDWYMGEFESDVKVVMDKDTTTPEPEVE